MHRYSVEALSDAESAVALAPKHVRGLMRKGVALYQLGKFEAAMESLNIAKEIDGKINRAVV